MRVLFDYWKGGKKHALTMSYDDGHTEDLRLVEIFDRYGIRGTFHLNSGNLGRDTWITAEDVARIFKNHEVSAHTVTHPHPRYVSGDELVYEIMEDRRRLESICGYPVRGMSYPYGGYDADVIRRVKELGIQYSRTVAATKKFAIPRDFLEWHPTCHHNDDIMTLLAKFKKQNRHLPLLYVWGHSYEFTNDNNWEKIEEFCSAAGGDPDTWYATNIEIVDYVNALRALVFTADRTMVYNPSATEVTISVDGEPVTVPGGATVKL